MAKVITLVDDMTQKPIPDGEGLTVRFSIQDSYYEMDLSADSFAKLEKLLGPWVEHATEVDPPRAEPVVMRPVKAVRAGAKPSESTMSSEQRTAIREWANANGFTVGDRGRIKAEVVEAFEKAHSS